MDQTMKIIWENFRIIDNIEHGIRLIISHPSFAVILTRNALIYYRYVFGKYSFYIPPRNGDSTFFSVLLSITARSTFKYQKEFNRL